PLRTASTQEGLNPMNTGSRRKALGLLMAASVALGVSACGESKPASGDSGPVTITVNALPAATDPVNRQKFLDDIAAFEKLHPKIKIDADEGKMDPQTFATKLAGGQLEDVFYVYFTDPANLITKHQVAEITSYLNDFPAAQQIKPALMRVFSDPGGKVYGLP